jgi:predicted TIM-barrel fold metal-dependent hydrolase
MRQGLDALHVDQAVLFPDHLLSLAMVRDPAFATALARAYNRWLHERWLTEERSLKGALVIAPQNPEAGAEDIRRHAGEREYACVYLPASGLKILYGDEIYDPVYRAAADAGLPVVIHSVEAIYPAFPFQLEQFRTSLAVHALAHPLSMVANLVSMLETAVPVRFPELKIGFMEAGTGWVPFIANRLDKEYVERRREVPLLQERPSRTMRRFFYGTHPIEEPERRAYLVALFELFDGENQAMFMSDWPHHDFDHPRHVFALPFSPEARRNIMRLNAARFFGIGPPHVTCVASTPLARPRIFPKAITASCVWRAARSAFSISVARFTACPTCAPTSGARCARGACPGRSTMDRIPIGSSRGSGKARSSRVRGIRSSSTSRAAAASLSRRSACGRTRCGSSTASCEW